MNRQRLLLAPLLSSIVIISSFFFPFHLAAAIAPPLEVEKEMHQTFLAKECTKDAECISSVEYHPACFHYCTGAECIKAMLCPAFRKDPTAILPNCAENIPCIKAGHIVCLARQCTSQE